MYAPATVGLPVSTHDAPWRDRTTPGGSPVAVSVAGDVAAGAV